MLRSVKRRVEEEGSDGLFSSGSSRSASPAHRGNHVRRTTKFSGLTLDFCDSDMDPFDEDSPPVRQGILYKLDDSAGMNRQRWRRRLFALRPEFLFFFRQHSSSESRNSTRPHSRSDTDDMSGRRSEMIHLTVPDHRHRQSSSLSPILLGIISIQKVSLIIPDEECKEDNVPTPPNETWQVFGLQRASGRKLWLSAPTEKEMRCWTDDLERIISQNRIASRALAVESSNLTARPFDSLGRYREESEIAFEELELHEKIGDGQFGDVYKARLWGTDVAVKMLKHAAGDVSLLDVLKKEIEIIQRLRHPNVLLYMGASYDPSHPVTIVTEWCDQGSLYDHLHSDDETTPFSFEQIIILALGIAQGLNYLHSLPQPILHRDVKSHNILLTVGSGGSFQAKVADFGLSCLAGIEEVGADQMNQENESNTPSKGKRRVHRQAYGVEGTPEWMAPEVITGEKYDEKVDVYGFGVTLSELLTRVLPFHDQYSISGFDDVADAVLDDGAVPTIPEWCGKHFRNLAYRCLNRNPAQRPSFMEIISELRHQLAEKETFFIEYDIPRLLDMLLNPNLRINIAAAREIAAMMPPSCETEIGLRNGLARDLRILDGPTSSIFLVRLLTVLQGNAATASTTRRLWLCRAIVAVVASGDGPIRCTYREILREEGGLNLLLSMFVEEQLCIQDSISTVITLLLEDLRIQKQIQFMDWTFRLPRSGKVLSGLAVFDHITKKRLNESRQSLVNAEKEASAANGLAQRVQTCCKIMQAEWKKRGHALTKYMLVSDGAGPEREKNDISLQFAMSQLNADDLEQKIDAEFLDDDAFDVVEIIPERPSELSNSWIEILGRGMYEHGLLWKEDVNLWQPIFMYLVHNSLYIFSSPDCSPHAYYFVTRIVESLTDIPILPLMQAPAHMLQEQPHIWGIENGESPLWIAVRSRRTKLQWAHYINRLHCPPPPPIEVIEKQRRMCHEVRQNRRKRQVLESLLARRRSNCNTFSEGMTRRNSIRSALVGQIGSISEGTTHNSPSLAGVSWMDSPFTDVIVEEIPSFDQNIPRHLLRMSRSQLFCWCLFWNSNYCSWEKRFIVMGKHQIRIYLSPTADPELPMDVWDISSQPYLVLRFKFNQPHALGVRWRGTAGNELYWLAFRTQIEQRLWAHELRPDLFEYPLDSPLQIPTLRENAVKKAETIVEKGDRDNDLVSLSSGIPSHWVDYFGEDMQLHLSQALQWRSDRTNDRMEDNWKPVCLLYSGNAIRVYEHIDDEPDDPLSVIYTTTHSRCPQSVDVEIDMYGGKPHCIMIAQPDDKQDNICIFALSERLLAQRWKALIQSSV